MTLGELQIINNEVFIQGIQTVDPTLIGMAVLDAIDEKEIQLHFQMESQKNFRKDSAGFLKVQNDYNGFR